VNSTISKAVNTNGSSIGSDVLAIGIASRLFVLLIVVFKDHVIVLHMILLVVHAVLVFSVVM